MDQAKKESRIKFLTVCAEYSALSWAISVAIHFFIIAVLMFITFRNYDSGGTSEGESFEVQLGTPAAQEMAAKPSIQPSTQQTNSNVVQTITTPVTAEEITIDTVESAEITIAEQSIEQSIIANVTTAFSESLSGSDTAGTAGFFGLTAGGTNFVYVIDRSGSMTGTRFATAIDELTRSVTALNENMNFYIIFYDSEFVTMNASKLVSASNANKKKHLQWAQSIAAQGGTDPTQAMLRAISLRPDSIWLLSDGQFDEAAVSEIKKSNSRGIQIHTLAFGSNDGEKQLKEIAAQNGGKYRYISIGN